MIRIPLSIGSVPLTSRTTTKSNLYLDSSLETVIKEPALYKLLTFHNPFHSESHVHIPSPGSFIQRIRPGPRLCLISRNKFIFYGEGLLAQAGGPPLVVCPLLLIQYIRSCPPYLEAIPSSATCGCAMLC
jgi:hypothetical protein